LKQLVTGSGVPMLKTIDLKELLVPIPEKSLQEEHTVLHKKVIELVKAKNNLEEEIEETIASFWDQ
jgi:restriction endonuclease S subunit